MKTIRLLTDGIAYNIIVIATGGEFMTAVSSNTETVNVRMYGCIVGMIQFRWLPLQNANKMINDPNAIRFSNMEDLIADLESDDG